MKTKRIIFIILIIIHCSIIFYFSNQISYNSNNQSSRVVEIISNIIPAIKNMNEVDKMLLKQNVLTPIVRKTAHVSIYTILGIYTICFASTFEKLNEKENIKKKIIYSILFCIFYAITDEFHQSLVPGRSCEVRDILIDSIGSLIGIGIIISITLQCIPTWMQQECRTTLHAQTVLAP